MTKTIILTIKLLEPTLVTSLDGDPNSAVSFKYLPGSVLRGMIIGKYMRQRKLKELDAANPETRRLFFDGSVRYLNGYPVDRLNQRALPTPISWYQEKTAQLLEKPEDPAGVYNLALEKPEQDVDLKKASKPFVTRVDDQTIQWVAPESQLTVHTSRDRKKGRSTKQSGDIFQYEALSAGQTFEAAILCENDQDADTIQKCLPKRLTIGGSRNAGYGRIEISSSELKKDWSEILPNEDAEEKLIVTFASDVLIRNGSGQYVTDPEVLKDAIAQRLGCSLTLCQSFVTAKPIGGFNRKWGLPLPQVTAVAMGSVLVFARPDNWPPEKLNDLLWQGIGEHRIDGFGRVVVDWQAKARLKVEPRSDYTSQHLKIEDPAGRTLAQQMVNRQFQHQLENKLAAYVNEIVTKALPIKNSQLSRLRLIVQNALLQLPDDGRKRLSDYLTKLDKRQVSRNQFSRAQLENESLLVWLPNRVNDSAQTIEHKLKLEKMPQIGDVPAKWTDDLRYEYNLRLIDAALAQALKLASKEERK